jgi:hypothetical protein
MPITLINLKDLTQIPTAKCLAHKVEHCLHGCRAMHGTNTELEGVRGAGNFLRCLSQWCALNFCDYYFLTNTFLTLLTKSVIATYKKTHHASSRVFDTKRHPKTSTLLIAQENFSVVRMYNFFYQAS